ncbi:MAG: hypothetical protein AAF799_25590 [Myxococcota bacterium]
MSHNDDPKAPQRISDNEITVDDLERVVGGAEPEPEPEPKPKPKPTYPHDPAYPWGDWL